MAITRSQIARQLLAEGGVSLDDAKMMAPPGEFLAYINPKEADMLRAAGGSGIMTAMGIPSFTEDEEDTGDVANPGGSMGGRDSSDDGFGGGDEFARPTYSQQLTDIQSTENTFPNLNEVTARDVFKVSASNPLLYRSGGERAALASLSFAESSSGL